MTIPGLPAWAAPDRPPPTPPGPGGPGGPPMDPPLLQARPDGSILVLPWSWFGWAGDDAANINYAALQASGSAGAAGGGGGRVMLGPWDYTLLSQITLPQNTTPAGLGRGAVSLAGVQGATRLLHQFTGTALWVHRTASYSPQDGAPAQPICGSVTGVTLDGTGAGAGSVGLDIGDGWGYLVDVDVVNYTAAGCIALNEINRLFWTEKARIAAHLRNNAIGWVIDTTNAGGAQRSHEYCDRTAYLFCNAAARTGGVDQQGIIIRNGAYCSGGSFRVRGNFHSSTSAISTSCLQVTGQDGLGNFSAASQVNWDLVVESIGAGGFGFQTINYGSVSNTISDCIGQFNFQFSPWVVSNLTAGAQLGGNLLISGDAVLGTAVTPGFPASGATVVNHGPPAVVVLSGGAITQVQVAGVTLPGVGAGVPIPVGSGQSIVVTYTGSPSWVWATMAAT